MPRSKKRKKAREQEAQAARAEQQKAEEKKKITPRQYARRRALGWGLVVAAVGVGASHWLAHIGMLYEDTALWDLTLGYPLAAILGVGGAVVLSD